MCTISSSGIDLSNDITGPDPLKNPVESLMNGFNQLLNAGVNVSSGGLMGYENGQITNGELVRAGQRNGNEIVNLMSDGILGVNDDGNIDFRSGVLTRAIDEGVGEISGRNAARAEAMETEDALREQRLNFENQRLFGLQQQEARERQASSRARRAAGNGTGSTGSEVEQQMATQWLGL